MRLVIAKVVIIASNIYVNYFRFSHQRLSESDIKKFIQQNEDFLIDVYKNFGKTNMDDYLFQYISEKTNRNAKEYLESLRVPKTAMIPMGGYNINKPPVLPGIPRMPSPQKNILSCMNIPQQNQNLLLQKFPNLNPRLPMPNLMNINMNYFKNSAIASNLMKTPHIMQLLHNTVNQNLNIKRMPQNIPPATLTKSKYNKININ
jgi:hypothetical protein